LNSAADWEFMTNVENHEKCWETGITGNCSCEALSRFIHCRNCPEYSDLGRTLFDQEMPEEYRQELSWTLSEPVIAPVEEAVSAVIFRVNAEWFAIKTNVFHEIIPAQHIYLLPFRSGSSLAGLVNVNGELLLCVSLYAVLGLSLEEKSEMSARPRLCVVGVGRERFAFCASEVLGVRRVPRSVLRTGPVTLVKSPAALTAWCFESDGLNIGLIDEKKFFDFLDRSLRW